MAVLTVKHIIDNKLVTINNQYEATQEKVVFDLTGEKFKKPGDLWVVWDDKNSLTIEPGQSIVILTKQSLSVAENVFGLVMSRVSLAKAGLIASNTKIDPKFVGQLEICLYNAGEKPCPLVKTEAFCSVVFFELIDPVDGAGRHSPTDRPLDTEKYEEYLEKKKQEQIETAKETAIAGAKATAPIQTTAAVMAAIAGAQVSAPEAKKNAAWNGIFSGAVGALVMFLLTTVVSKCSPQDPSKTAPPPANTPATSK